MIYFIYEYRLFIWEVVYMKLSVVIPCYNSGAFLENTIQDLEQVLKKEDYEIILVNDCSSDNTYDVIKKLAKKNGRIKGISFSKNFGQHAALMAGFSYCTGDLILCMDDDGQTLPSEVPKLISALDDATDVVYAKYITKKHSLFRNFGSYINSKMLEWLLGKPKNLTITSFFIARKYVIDEILRYKSSYPYVSGLILRSTSKIKNVMVTHKERTVGKSGYSMKKLISLWMNGFTAFSIKPLRIANFLGALTAMIGFIYMIILIIRRLIIGYSVVQGWNSLISVILFIGGIIMCILGMIGEYLGRIYICNNNAPQYVVRETTYKEKR